MANQVRTFGTKLNNTDRRAFAPINIQNRHQDARGNINKPFQASVNSYGGCFDGQENVPFAFKEGKSSLATKSCNYGFNQKETTSFQILDEGIFSQETSQAPCDDETMLDVNIEAVKKELNSFLIDSLEKHSSEISERENKENPSVSFLEDSLMVVDSKETNSEDSVLDQSEISYVQQYSVFDRFADYSEAILLYMLEKERKYMPDAFYMSRQPNINSKMRSILVDWLVDVADEYNIKDETLFLAINYIDRFLSTISISRQEFQLLGTAALFIATKYEEIYPPEIGEFVYITDDSFTKLQILQMEKLVLQTLDFDVSTPTANYFLEKFVTDLELDKEVYCLAKYLCVLSQLECNPFIKYYPSEIALCSILLAGRTLGVQIPDDYVKSTLVYEHNLGTAGNVGQLESDRKILLDELAKMQEFAAEHQQQAIQRKYSSSKYYKVSKIAVQSN